MTYKTESEMYPHVRAWLADHLGSRFPGADIAVRDTHSLDLKTVVSRSGLQPYFTDESWQTYEIKVDVTAFLLHRGSPALVFTECKNKPISLLHLAQLLGYCRIARPLMALLLSPYGPGDALRSLLLRYDRSDILEYDWPARALPRSVIVATWHEKSKSIDPSSLLPPGATF